MLVELCRLKVTKRGEADFCLGVSGQCTGIPDTGAEFDSQAEVCLSYSLFITFGPYNSTNKLYYCLCMHVCNDVSFFLVNSPKPHVLEHGIDMSVKASQSTTGKKRLVKHTRYNFKTAALIM